MNDPEAEYRGIVLLDATYTSILQFLSSNIRN